MRVIDVDIERCVEQSYGFVPHSDWIPHCKEPYLLTLEKLEDPRKPWDECPPEKRLIIKEGFANFGLCADEQPGLAAGADI